MNSVFEHISSFTDWFITLGLFVSLYLIVMFVLKRQSNGKRNNSLLRQFILFAIVITGFIALVLAIPMGDSTRSQITTLIGIVISAVLALSSATFIGNGLAGIMMRIINNFRIGDFVRVGDHFGRITERGLFHTELQTEDSDLITFPNLFFVNNPVKVTHSAGTFISASVSLGYDINHHKIEEALLKGAHKIGLSDPFVHLTKLNDFSISYRVFGFLTDVKGIITSTSELRKSIIDSLHDHGIEIVSPTFMNTRAVEEEHFIPQRYADEHNLQAAEKPEQLIFEKADLAESIEHLGERVIGVEEQISVMESAIKKASKEDKIPLKEKLEKLKNMKTYIEAVIDKKNKEK